MDGVFDALFVHSVILCGQLAYVWGFRPSFNRQLDAVESYPFRCLGLGFAAFAIYAGAMAALAKTGLFARSAIALSAAVSPLFVAICAGSAVGLTALAGRVARKDPRPLPYGFLIFAQLAAAVLSQVPFAGKFLLGLYASAGLGALLRHERAAGRADEEERLGADGFLWLGAAAAVLCIFVTLGAARMARNARETLPEPPSFSFDR